eukprot:m.180093 g.180093  ORF g.180093 m.180093 type:complete len:471 (+) comp15491_c0_seq4:320-1732(+)
MRTLSGEDVPMENDNDRLLPLHLPRVYDTRRRRRTSIPVDVNVSSKKRVMGPEICELFLFTVGVALIILFVAMYPSDEADTVDAGYHGKAVDLFDSVLKESVVEEEDDDYEDNSAGRQGARQQDVSLPNDGYVRNGGYYNDQFQPHWMGQAKCSKPLQSRSQSVGVLPAVLILGVHKGGSTALFSHLVDHGQIRPSYCKELHFFDYQFNAISRRNMNAKNITLALISEYSKYFRGRQPESPPFLSIEATPGYFPMALQVPVRIKSLLPNVTLLVALRHPVLRTVSHFIGHRLQEFKKFDTCDEWFENNTRIVGICSVFRPTADLKSEFDLWRKQWDKYSRCLLRHDNPVIRSLYAPQLFQWLQVFSPKQLSVIQSEQFYKNPGQEIDKIIDFLGIRRHFNEERTNFGKKIGSDHNAMYEKWLSEKRRYRCNLTRMHEFFKPFEDSLFDIFLYYYPEKVKTWSVWSKIWVR